jgi:hypothetical protein
MVEGKSVVVRKVTKVREIKRRNKEQITCNTK